MSATKDRRPVATPYDYLRAVAKVCGVEPRAVLGYVHPNSATSGQMRARRVYAHVLTHHLGLSSPAAAVCMGLRTSQAVRQHWERYAEQPALAEVTERAVAEVVSWGLLPRSPVYPAQQRSSRASRMRRGRRAAIGGAA